MNSATVSVTKVTHILLIIIKTMNSATVSVTKGNTKLLFCTKMTQVAFICEDRQSANSPPN